MHLLPEVAITCALPRLSKTIDVAFGCEAGHEWRDAMAEIDPLIQSAQRGDPKALRELLGRYRADVSRIAFRVVGPTPDLEDVVQEALVQVCRSLPSYAGDSKFSTWLYRVVTNVARMHLRREGVRPRLRSATAKVPEAPPSGHDQPDHGLERNRRLQALYCHLEGLSDKKRTVLVLHDLEGMPASEIAKIVEVPVMTVRTRLFYARKELYAALAGDPALGELLAEHDLLPRGEVGDG